MCLWSCSWYLQATVAGFVQATRSNSDPPWRTSFSSTASAPGPSMFHRTLRVRWNMLFGLKLVKPSTITETHSRSRNITRTRLRKSSKLSPQQIACQVLTVKGYSRQARCRFSNAFNSQETTSRVFRTPRSNSRRVRRLNKPDHTQMWCQDHECRSSTVMPLQDFWKNRFSNSSISTKPVKTGFWIFTKQM